MLAGSGRPAADWLLVNVAADYASIALLRGPHLIFFRNRAADTDGTLADLVHQSAMYYEDRLKGAGFARVILAGAAAGRAAVGRHRSGAPQPRGTPDDAGRDRRPADGGGAHRPHLGRAGAARHAGAARRACCATGIGTGAGVIRTNLSTRPFYNERAVHVWLLAIALAVAAATIFNVSRVMRYSRSDTQLATQASRDEARAADLRQQAARLRASVDPRQVDLASADARQANDLIDRRTFSWTELFNRFETTLPDDVRITAVRPKIDRDRTASSSSSTWSPEAWTTSTCSWRTSTRPARFRACCRGQTA